MEWELEGRNRKEKNSSLLKCYKTILVYVGESCKTVAQQLLLYVNQLTKPVLTLDKP